MADDANQQRDFLESVRPLNLGALFDVIRRSLSVVVFLKIASYRSDVCQR